MLIGEAKAIAPAKCAAARGQETARPLAAGFGSPGHMDLGSASAIPLQEPVKMPIGSPAAGLTLMVGGPGKACWVLFFLENPSFPLKI